MSISSTLCQNMNPIQFTGHVAEPIIDSTYLLTSVSFFIEPEVELLLIVSIDDNPIF